MLYMTARTGLFLSVVVWAVSQWWSADITVSYGGRGFLAGLAPTCLLVESPLWIGNQLSIDVYPTKDSGEEAILSGTYFEQTWKIPGASFSSAGRLNWLILHHWLVVAVFIVFNLILHAVYRRHTGARPREN